LIPILSILRKTINFILQIEVTRLRRNDLSLSLTSVVAATATTEVRVGEAEAISSKPPES
jgi:hypothetical protein